VSGIQRRASRCAGVALVATLAACAPAPPAVLVHASDPSALKGLRFGQPFIVEFNQGETIPLSLVIRGQFIETPPDANPVTLVAKRHFFLRVQGRQVQTSADGHFDEKQTARGAFDIGFNFDASGTKAHIAIVTPTYELPAQ
jgi:hypothetical protein